MGGDGSDVMSRIVLNQLKGVCKGDVYILHYQFERRGDVSKLLH